MNHIRHILIVALLVLATIHSSNAQPITDGQTRTRRSTVESSKIKLETLPDLVRRVKPSVVSILTYDSNGEPTGSGSGFIIRTNEVVTNAHVVHNAYRVEIRTLQGKGKTYPVAGALAIDNEADLALLRVYLSPEHSRLSLATNPPEEGEPVFVIGSPLRLDGSVSDGIVSAVREIPALGRIIQTTAPISHGSSGSPLFNMRGLVIGVITMKVTNGQNINLALASARLASLQHGPLVPFSEIESKDPATESKGTNDFSYRDGLHSMWVGNYESALSYFETAANRNPQHPETWIQIGYCKVKQGRNEEAIRAYQRALILRPASADALNKLGDAYFYAGRFPQAIEAYKQAAHLRPRDGEAYYNLALAYLETGNTESALAQSRILATVDSNLSQKLLSEIRR